MPSLKNATIWLTGASTGIGRALAIELVARGARVVLTARNLGALEKLVGEITKSGGWAVAMPGDVLNLSEMKAIAAKIEGDLGAPIDMLIANAGTHLFTKPEQFDSAEYLSLMNTNYGGMLHCIEAALPKMLERKRGHIVGMASLAGMRGLPTAGAYGASKAAMINFLDSIRFHLVRHGIQVTVINPGFVKTPLTDKNPFKMPFLISAEQAAKSIADGLERRTREISFPFPFNWFVKLGKFLPAPLYEKIVDKMW